MRSRRSSSGVVGALASSISSAVISPPNKADALRFLGWLKSTKSIRPSLGGVFGSDRLGVAVQAFVDHLRENGRSWSTCAGYVKSFVVVARFVHAVRVARAQQQGSGGSSGAAQEASATAATAATSTTVSTMPVDDMQRAHKQIMQQARLEQKFAEAKKPAAWLDWSAVFGPFH